EDRVLDRVVALGQLGDEKPGLARLAEPVEPLTLVALRVLLGRAERVELPAAEEVGVARDDRRLLRDLLLAHAYRAALLRALEEVALELGLVLGRASDGGRAHLTSGTYTNLYPRTKHESTDRSNEVVRDERLRDDGVRA